MSSVALITHIALVAAMSWFGLRVSGRVQLVIAAVLGLLLAGATLVPLPHAEPANLTPFAPHGWLAAGSAAALLVWAFGSTSHSVHPQL